MYIESPKINALKQQLQRKQFEEEPLIFKSDVPLMKKGVVKYRLGFRNFSMNHDFSQIEIYIIAVKRKFIYVKKIKYTV